VNRLELLSKLSQVEYAAEQIAGAY
jgi:hypothetical protein